MRIGLRSVALLILFLSGPAGAATTLWNIQIEVFATGSKVTSGMNPVMVVEPYASDFTFVRHLYAFNGVVDINSGFDSPISDPLGLGIRYGLTGQLSFTGGEFIGTDFRYSSTTCRIGGPGCVDYSLRADTFRASYIGFSGEGPGPVPEPTTWAMMMFGFGGIGYSMRRRRNARLAQRFA